MQKTYTSKQQGITVVKTAQQPAFRFLILN